MSWEALEQVVAAKVLLDAFETSDRLRRLGVPHALVGGLAVGHHGHPRATKDVDFIVGDEAFAKTSPLFVFRDELADLVQWGTIDLLATTDDPPLMEALCLPEEGEVPIVPMPALVLMKLRASRPQDLADVSQLVAAGMDVGEVLAFLREMAPEHVAPFSAIAQRALGG
ncbi:MAG: hypothetical protein JRI25_24360 [Deltaproteobacteria bacterium]|nr:hypothetical protein [Deltaproteobacteria bacterium]